MDEKTPLDQKILAYVLTLGGLAGLIFSLALSVEKLNLLKDPDHTAACNINPLISCSFAIDPQWSELVGIPHSFFGIAAFAALMAIGAVMFNGISLRPWLRLGLQTGASAGMIAAHVLIYQSLYIIGALCPFCMGVWVVTIAIFWYVTAYNLGFLKTTGSGFGRTALNFVFKHHLTLLVVWYLVIALLILHRFWYFWSTLI